MEIAPKINPPLRTLLGPGPSPVNPRVQQSLSLPVIGHLDPAFLKIKKERRKGGDSGKMNGIVSIEPAGTPHFKSVSRVASYLASLTSKERTMRSLR